MALASVNKGSINPIVIGWSAIQCKLPKLDSTLLKFTGWVIKCLKDFFKEFICKCVTKVSDAWEGLSLKVISAEEIPRRLQKSIGLPKMTADGTKMLECLNLQDSNIPNGD